MPSSITGSIIGFLNNGLPILTIGVEAYRRIKEAVTAGDDEITITIKLDRGDENFQTLIDKTDDWLATHPEENPGEVNVAEPGE